MPDGMANSKNFLKKEEGREMELTTFAAARIFDANPVVLQRLVAQGRLQARKDENGHWQINRKSLEQWNEKRLARRREKQRVRRSPKSERAGAAA